MIEMRVSWSNRCGFFLSMSCPLIGGPDYGAMVDVKATAADGEAARAHPCEIDAQSVTLSGRKAQV